MMHTEKTALTQLTWNWLGLLLLLGLVVTGVLLLAPNGPVTYKVSL